MRSSPIRLLLVAKSLPAADATSIEDFNPLWIAGFKHTNAYEVWERVTDPLLFDIVEPRYVSTMCFRIDSTCTGTHVLKSPIK